MEGITTRRRSRAARAPIAELGGDAAMRPQAVAILVLGLVSCGIVACGQSDPKSVDLHAIDWRSVVLPGSVCGATQLIRLRGGRAVVRSTRWPPYRRISVDANWEPKRVSYGDLDGDGRDEAALGVDCNNGGGTADGILAFARVIFTAGDSSPRVVGVITPQHVPPHAYPTLVQTTIKPAGVIAREYWYRRSDIGPCCPSGRSTTFWTYRDATLRAVGTVLQPPRR